MCVGGIIFKLPFLQLKCKIDGHNRSDFVGNMPRKYPTVGKSNSVAFLPLWWDNLQIIRGSKQEVRRWGVI